VKERLNVQNYYDFFSSTCLAFIVSAIVAKEDSLYQLSLFFSQINKTQRFKLGQLKQKNNNKQRLLNHPQKPP